MSASPTSSNSAQTVYLTESTGTKIVRNIVRTIVVFVALLFILSIFVPVDEVTKARGEIVPVGNVQRIQTLDGGLIEQLLVEEGQAVKAGDVIARFEPTGAKAELAAAITRRGALEASSIRLQAFLDGKEPDFTALEVDFPRIVAEQRRALLASAELATADAAVLTQRVSETRAEIAGVETELPVAERQQKISAEALAREKNAVDRGVISRVEYEAKVQEEAGYARQLADLRGKLVVLKEKLSEMEKALTQGRGKSQSDARDQRAEVVAKLREANDQIANLQRRVERTTLLASVDGYINSVPESKSGAVIQPGGIVCEIVPLSANFILKAKVMPKDIGFLQRAQPAVVKVDAFDYSRYGSLPGALKDISPTTIAGREGTPYFEVRVALNRSQYDVSGRVLSVSAGMTGEADIRTGRKTVFQYLWKPVFTTFKSAFSER